MKLGIVLDAILEECMLEVCCCMTSASRLPCLLYTCLWEDINADMLICKNVQGDLVLLASTVLVWSDMWYTSRLLTAQIIADDMLRDEAGEHLPC